MKSKLTAGGSRLDQLVDRQMRNWELARTQRLSTPVPTRREVEDFVCVSRQVGVDDKQVATLVGGHLGWPVFDREILDSMAGDDERRRRVYASMDERDLGWWEETLRSLMQGSFVKNDYFHRLCQTLLSLARQGTCVFVGRGADLVLPRDRGFRVRLVAPLEMRVERFAAALGLDLAKARKAVETLDRERSEFFQNHFGVDANDPLRHDISLNLAGFTREKAADLILEARRIFVRGR